MARHRGLRGSAGRGGEGLINGPSNSVAWALNPLDAPARLVTHQIPPLALTGWRLLPPPLCAVLLADFIANPVGRSRGRPVNTLNFAKRPRRPSRQESRSLRGTRRFVARTGPARFQASCGLFCYL